MQHFYLEFWLIGEGDHWINFKVKRNQNSLIYRVGRKPIIILSMTGTSLSLAWELAVIGLPRFIRVEFILAGPLFAVVGGGNTVLLANLYSIASDLVVQSDRYALTVTHFDEHVMSNI